MSSGSRSDNGRSDGAGPERGGRRKQERRGGAEPPGLYVFSREAIRAVDEAALREYAIPGILLMEHASLALVPHVEAMARGGPEREILIVCGKGNNGGDGLALARHLHIRGRAVRVILAAAEDAYSGDALINLRAVRGLRAPLATAEPGNVSGVIAGPRGAPGLVVDALLGTGATGAPRGVARELIQAINGLSSAGVPVLAVDLPSGMDADTGGPSTDDPRAANDEKAREDAARAAKDPCVVRADRTVTFVGLKRGFLSLEAQELLGDVYVEEIGAPLELVERLGERLEASVAHGADAERPKPPQNQQGAGRGRRGGRGEGGGFRR